MNFIKIFNGINSFRLSYLIKNNELKDSYITTAILLIKRFKFTQYNGVKGLKNRKSQFITNQQEDDDGHTKSENDNEEEKNEVIDLKDREYDTLASSTLNVVNVDNLTEQRVFIIQPYIKWGPEKKSVKPDLQLKEAESLIKSLPNWSVELSIKVPLESLEKKSLFGSGKMKEIKEMFNKCKIHGKSITCLFISKSTLTYIQKRYLQNEFNVPIMDRYSIVIQILRLHAISVEAKLQVAMAEIPYIWNQIKEINPSISRKYGYSLTDAQKELLNAREKKLKNQINNIRNHRQLLRNKRKQSNCPIISVIGYTNAGKTSLIKALTEDKMIKPKDQLFATLDVTAHSGILPCKLKVVYMDTVGFMSDLPTGLIESFVATLEDAMLSDLILNVQDISHENYEEQRKHVDNTLKSLFKSIKMNNNKNEIMNDIKIPPIINVGNKIDLIKDFHIIKNEISNEQNDIKFVSSITLNGLNDLMLSIESKILQTTDRIKLRMRVNNGGSEMQWLYKNATIINSQADLNHPQSILLDVIIHNSKLQIFKHHFVRGKN